MFELVFDILRFLQHFVISDLNQITIYSFKSTREIELIR